MRLAYIVNQYPKVSHTFIRREILALERCGFEVLRVAMRGWSDVLADDEDVRERARTRYVLEGGLPALLWAILCTLTTAPVRFARTLALALRMGWRGKRALPYHLAYLAEACRVLAWVKSFRADHVHAHFATNSAEVAMLLRALGGPSYSFTLHGTAEFDDLGSLGIVEKLSRAAFVVAASCFAQSQLYRRIDYSSWAKIHVVHCGLERAFFATQPSPPPATARLVCVGRLSAEKGQILLVEAVHRLARKGIRVELTLAGDGELRAELERLIGQKGLAGQVRITGWISSLRVRDEILASRALVLPSFSEGLPVVIMEAMALGRPVVATCVGGIPELVRAGQDGWLVPAGSVDALAAALEECLRAPEPELRAMGERARLRAGERHSIEVEAAKLAELFRQLGGASPANSAAVQPRTSRASS